MSFINLDAVKQRAQFGSFISTSICWDNLFDSHASSLSKKAIKGCCAVKTPFAWKQQRQVFFRFVKYGFSHLLLQIVL